MPVEPEEGKQHPAALCPKRVVDGGIAAPGRIGRHIGHHFGLVDDGPFLKVLDAAIVGRRLAEFIETRPVERAVLVKKGNRGAQFLALDRRDLIARGAFERRRPDVDGGGVHGGRGGIYPVWRAMPCGRRLRVVRSFPLPVSLIPSSPRSGRIEGLSRLRAPRASIRRFAPIQHEGPGVAQRAKPRSCRPARSA